MNNYKDRFIRHLQSKGYTQASIAIYITPVMLFWEQTGKEPVQVTKVDILHYLEYLKKQKGLQNTTRRMHLTGLNHFFTFLYEKEEIGTNPCALIKIRGANKISLYRTFTGQQLEALFETYYQLQVKDYDYSQMPSNRSQQAKLCRFRNASELSIFIHQGITTTELDRVLLQDLNLQKATIRIRGSKKSNERNLSLKAEQIGLLMHYLKEIRPQFLTAATFESQKLFLPYPMGNKTKDPENLIHSFKWLTKQVKEIEPVFVNFKQIRASVITHWLKIHGLRKAQYMAGHRYIKGTELYLRNNLEDLTNDIGKHHPF